MPEYFGCRGSACWCGVKNCFRFGCGDTCLGSAAGVWGRVRLDCVFFRIKCEWLLMHGFLSSLDVFGVIRDWLDFHVGLLFCCWVGGNDGESLLMGDRHHLRTVVVVAATALLRSLWTRNLNQKVHENMIEIFAKQQTRTTRENLKSLLDHVVSVEKGRTQLETTWRCFK